MASRQEIYQGFWTNHIDGHVKGATLTLSREGGAYIIAFLALFVHMAGSSFWRLASFVIFYVRAHPDLDNNVTEQQQTVFRNSTSAVGSFRGFLRVSIRSREWKKNLPVILWAGVNVVGFLVAGIFSSRVTSTRSEVLLKPTQCGQWTYTEELHSNQSDILVEEAIRFATTAKIKSTSQQYAAICYNLEDSPEGCSTYGRRAPRWNARTENGCPFADDLCIDNTTFSMDSDLASDLDLGINSPPSDRVTLRTRLSCAPLKQNGYTKTYTGTEVKALFRAENILGSSKVLARARFGEALEHHKFDAFFYGPAEYTGNIEESAATFIFNHGTFAQSVGSSTVNDVYLAPIFELTYNDGPLRVGSGFKPIPALRVPEHKVSLMFLSSIAWSSNLISDPWFKTDHPIQIQFSIQEHPPKTYTVYERDPVTTVLGCAQKYETCVGTSTDDMRCIVTTGSGQTYSVEDEQTLLGLNPRQTMIVHRLRQANIMSSLETVVQGLGGTGLLAYEYSLTTWEPPLPSDQWALEVKNWFLIMLTIKQAYTMQYVTGLPDKRFDQYIVPPSKEAEWMCHSQIVQRTDYASFSVLGTCIILVLGGSLILLNALISRLSSLLLPHSARHQFRESSWDANELLNLRAAAFGRNIHQVDSHSSAAEEAGIGSGRHAEKLSQLRDQ